MHETGNVINGIGGKVCGGVGGLFMTDVIMEKEEEDGFEVSRRDV